MRYLLFSIGKFTSTYVIYNMFVIANLHELSVWAIIVKYNNYKSLYKSHHYKCVDMYISDIDAPHAHIPCLS